MRNLEEIDELMRLFTSMPQDAEQLVALLSDRNWLVREAAAMRLVRLREKVRDSVLIDALGNEAPQVRGQTALELGWRKCKAAGPILLSLLASDPSGHVRSTCAIALGQIGGHAALNGLVAALDDEDARVRLASCSAFRRRKSRRAASRLQSMLSDPDFYVRECVVDTLVSFGIADDRLVETAEQLLTDPVFIQSEAGLRETEDEIRTVLGDPEQLRRHAESTGQTARDARENLKYTLRTLQKEDFMSRSRLERLAERVRELIAEQNTQEP